MKTKTTTIILIAVLAALLIGAALLIILLNNNGTEGSKSITVEIVSEKDNYSSSKTYKTDELYLGEFLAKEKLVEYESSQYGRYIVGAGGITQDAASGYYWMVKENGEYTPNGIDETAIVDGAKYTIILEKYS